MVAALRTLARDGWVIGIAAAAALAYATVKFLEAAIAVVLSIIDGVPWPEETTSGTIDDLLDEQFNQQFDVPWAVELNGHFVYLEPLVRAAILFLIVVPLAAAALHATRSKNDADSGEAEA